MVLWQVDQPSNSLLSRKRFFLNFSFNFNGKNFILIVKVHKSTLHISIILHSEICNRILICLNKYWLVHLNPENFPVLWVGLFESSKIWSNIIQILLSSHIALHMSADNFINFSFL